MRFGRWLAATLFVAGIFALDWYGPSVRPSPDQSQQEGYYYSAGPDTETKPDTETSDDRIAKYTEWLAYLTGVLGIVSYLQWNALRAQEARLKESIDKAEAASARQTKDMQASIATAADANRLSREQLEFEQRPWLAFDVRLSAPITWDVNGCNFQFLFVIRNVGKTPARNASVELKVYSPMGAGVGTGAEWPSPAAQQRKFADEVRARPPLDWGFTVFPGDKLIQEFKTTIGNEEIERVTKWFKDTHGTENGTLAPSLVGCLNYRFVTGGPSHQTGFIFDIVRTVAVNNSVAISRDVGDIPLEHLALYRYWQDGRTD